MNERTPTVVTRNCAECQQLFHYTIRRGRPPVLCSVRCCDARKARILEEYNKRLGKERHRRLTTCAVCAKDFEGASNRARYCSDDCRLEAYRRRLARARERREESRRLEDHLHES